MNAPTPERKPVTEEISSLIERVTFYSDESGFCVLRVKTRGQREDVTVVGSLPSVTAGEWLVAEGWWVRDKEHGLQFKAVMMKTVPPTTLATQHYMLLQRNLIYTGIPRGKRLLVLVGQKKALAIAGRNDRPQRRYSGLLASLRGDRRAATV